MGRKDLQIPPLTTYEAICDGAIILGVLVAVRLIGHAIVDYIDRKIFPR